MLTVYCEIPCKNKATKKKNNQEICALGRITIADCGVCRNFKNKDMSAPGRKLWGKREG